MASTVDRLKAIELEKQGYPKTEIAKMLNVSRQTVYEWLKDAEEKDAPEQESGKAVTNDGIDQFTEKYDRIASDIVEKADNEFYGQIISKILARHGIFIDGNTYDKISQYIERYNADDLETAVNLAQRLRDIGIAPEDFDPDADPKNMQYFPVFVKFLNTPYVRETIEELVKKGFSRSDAIYSVLYHSFLEWESADRFKGLLQQIGNAVVSEIVRKASGTVDRRMADIESEAVDKVGQVMVPFQRVLTDKMEEIESRIDGLVRTFDEKLDDKLESFLKLSEAEEELRPKHRIAGIGVFKPKIPIKEE
jgi:predicted transcriptional regulator/gas vesicle protein